MRRDPVRQNVSLQCTQAGGAIVRSWPPLHPGVTLEAIMLYIQTQAAFAATASLYVLEVYACSAPPRSVAEARLGDPIFAAETLPLYPVRATATDNTFGVQLQIPLQYQAYGERRTLTIVYTPTTHDVYGFACLRVR